MKRLGIAPAGRIVFGSVNKNGTLGKHDEIDLGDFVDVVRNFVHDDTVDEVAVEMSAEKQFDYLTPDGRRGRATISVKDEFESEVPK